MSSSIAQATSYTSGQGIDVTSTVDQIIESERGPETQMKHQQSVMNQQIAMLRQINTQLSSLGNAVTALRDVAGALQAQQATSADPARLSVSATSAAKSASHWLEITSLASTASTYTDGIAADATLSGELSFKVGGALKSIVIDGTCDTVEELVTKINGGDYGVTASTMNDAAGVKLVLVSNTCGLAGDITEISGLTGLTFHPGLKASNSVFTIDGVPLQRATNTITDALPGVTLNLLDETSAPVKITIAPNATSMTQAIQTFVSAYNTVIQTINGQFTVDPTTNTVGTLSSDGTLRVLQSQLLEQISSVVGSNSALTTLRSVGLEMQNDGTLTVNSSALNDAITNRTAEFRSFFQNETDGFAVKFGDKMMKLNNTADGLLYVDIQGLNGNVKSIADQISDFEDRLELRRMTLLDQYSRLDAELRQMPLLLQQISSQLGTNKG